MYLFTKNVGCNVGLQVALRYTSLYAGPSAERRKRKCIFELLNLLPEILQSFYRNLSRNENIKIVFQKPLTTVKRSFIFMGFHVIYFFT
jgi:hypothetical protein